MSYHVVFPSKRVERSFEKSLAKISADYQAAIAAAIRSLANNPRPEGKRTKRLTGGIIMSQFIAQYRLRIGPYRLLYDIDDQKRIVVLLKLTKRDEHTYT